MRKEIPLDKVEEALDVLKTDVLELCDLRKFISFASDYECIGVIMEEVSRYTGAMMANNDPAVKKGIRSLARVVAFCLACSVANTLE